MDDDLKNYRAPTAEVLVEFLFPAVVAAIIIEAIARYA